MAIRHHLAQNHVATHHHSVHRHRADRLRIRSQNQPSTPTKDSQIRDQTTPDSAIRINGPEFVAHAVSDWCRFNSAGSLFIDPGSPWQNAWIGSFNGRLRDELLNSWRFDSLREARVIIGDWRCDYNANRPHSAHGELTPAEFALQWTTTHQPQVA